MAKTDIESAFRLFPVHPEDWELLRYPLSATSWMTFF